MRWALVIGLWLLTAHALLQTTQGTYEDHLQVNRYSSLTAARPPFWTARGMTNWTIWQQARQQATPRAMRAVNLSLSVLVVIAVGALAWQLGLPVWIAVGTMALHPLSVEAIAALSGRGELIATIGLLGACLAVATSRLTVWRVLLCGVCLGVGYLGKETIAVAVPLVPLTYVLVAQRSGAVGLIGAQCLLIMAWSVRSIGLLVDTGTQSGWIWFVRQSGAAFRLMTLAVIPWRQSIDPDIDTLAWAWCLAAVACLIALTVWAVQCWQAGDRPLALGLAWMLCVTLPRLIVLTPKSYFNEHQFYPALVGVALIAAAIYKSTGAPYADLS